MTMGSILIWIVLGAISGWLAGRIMKGRGLGTVGNIIVGILGSFIGGWVGGKMGFSSASVGGLSIASILTAVVGACILLFLIGLVKKKD